MILQWTIWINYLINIVWFKRLVINKLFLKRQKIIFEHQLQLLRLFDESKITMKCSQNLVDKNLKCFWILVHLKDYINIKAIWKIASISYMALKSRLFQDLTDRPNLFSNHWLQIIMNFEFSIIKFLIFTNFEKLM